MNIETFRLAHDALKNGPFKGISFNELWAQAQEAAAPEHAPTNVGTGMVDTIRCSCGWVSHPFFDGAPYALNDWRWHVACESHVDQPQRKFSV